MRFINFKKGKEKGIAVLEGDTAYGFLENEARYPGDILSLIQKGGNNLERAGKTMRTGQAFDLSQIEYLPPITPPSKIICIGLNYFDHSIEVGFQQPEYPTVFARFATSMTGHLQPLIKTQLSDEFDYEVELVAVIGKKGKRIARENALEYVVGYSIFNDASIRDYQFKSPQWTMGKNFDATGSFGPMLVTADELPPGAKGLQLQTRLNGEVLQNANTNDMVFDVAHLIELLSQVMTLEPGDLLVTGTPSGIGLGRKPPIWMKVGDVCEVEIEGIGILSNTIEAEVV